ncbi:unnamed protein product [Cyprideis torosa]|uniref:Uncharacterized protein n=1 Tax=Cyprideis torosa TaxID=163714 RepID=A0A7R8WMV8_9CRUS|nr:unnamed protein product [Cyprideis torosa]CAG0898897.1 unnamed protein product [Cyprideis torosa]
MSVNNAVSCQRRLTTHVTCFFCQRPSDSSEETEYSEDMKQHLLQTPLHHIDGEIHPDVIEVMVAGAERSGILLQSEPEPWETLSEECICDDHAFQTAVEDDCEGMPSLVPENVESSLPETSLHLCTRFCNRRFRNSEDMKQHLLETPVHHINGKIDPEVIEVMVAGAERSPILLELEKEPWEPFPREECICGMPVEKDVNHGCILLKLSTSDVHEVQCKACLKKFKLPSSAKDHVMWGCPNLEPPRFKCHVCDKYLKTLGSVRTHLGNVHGLEKFIVEAVLKQPRREPPKVIHNPKLFREQKRPSGEMRHGDDGSRTVPKGEGVKGLTLSLQEERDSLKAEVERLSKLLEKTRQETLPLHVSLKEAAEEAARLRAAKQKAELKAEELEKSNANLSAEVDLLQSQITERHQVNESALKNEVKRLETDMMTREAEFERAKVRWEVQLRDALEQKTGEFSQRMEEELGTAREGMQNILEQKDAEVERIIRDKDAEIKRLEEGNSSLRNDLKEMLEAHDSQLKQQQKMFEEKIEAISQQLAAKEEEKRDAVETLKERVSLMAALEAELSSLKDVGREVEALKEESKIRDQKHQSEKEDFSLELQSLKSQLVEAWEEVSRKSSEREEMENCLKSKLHSKEVELRGKVEEVIALHRSVADGERGKAELLTSSEEKDQEIWRLSEELKHRETELSSAEGNVLQLQEAVSHLEKELLVKDTELEEEKESLAALSQTEADLNRCVEDLKYDVSSVKSALKTKEEALHKLEEQLQKNVQQNENLLQKNAELTKSWEEKSRQWSAERDDLESHLRETQESVRILSKEKSDCEKEVVELAQRLQDAEDSLRNAQKEVDAVQLEGTRRLKEVTEKFQKVSLMAALEAELSSLKDVGREVEALKEESKIRDQKHQSEMHSKEVELRGKVEEVIALHKSVADGERGKAELLTSSEEKDQEIRRLSEELKHKETELSSAKLQLQEAVSRLEKELRVKDTELKGKVEEVLALQKSVADGERGKAELLTSSEEKDQEIRRLSEELKHKETELSSAKLQLQEAVSRLEKELLVKDTELKKESRLCKRRRNRSSFASPNLFSAVEDTSSDSDGPATVPAEKESPKKVSRRPTRQMKTARSEEAAIQAYLPLENGDPESEPLSIQEQLELPSTSDSVAQACNATFIYFWQS